MRRAARRAWIVLALCGCANTRDVYVGADFPAAPAGSGSAAEARDAAPAAPPNAAGSGAPDTVRDAAPAAPASDAGRLDDDDDDDDARVPDAAALDATAPAPPVTCSPGSADCDGDASNGCEVDTERDMAHCGGCDRRCHSEGHDATAAQCNAGRCELTCRQDLLGDHDCDFDPNNGCESALLTDDQNCGECGRVCTCFNGSCI